MSIIVSIETDLGKVAHAFVVGAEKTKAALVWAAHEVETVEPEIVKVEDVANKMIAQVYPGADVVALAIEAGFGAILDAVDAIGTAAEANGLNVSLDAAAVAKVKAALPIIKAQAKTTPGA